MAAPFASGCALALGLRVGLAFARSSFFVSVSLWLRTDVAFDALFKLTRCLPRLDKCSCPPRRSAIEEELAQSSSGNSANVESGLFDFRLAATRKKERVYEIEGKVDYSTELPWRDGLFGPDAGAGARRADGTWSASPE
jgi:hypothetical protein